MDLDDLLEDLLEGVADSTRRRVRRVRHRASRRTEVARRRLRRAARAGGVLFASVFGVLALALALAGTPGGFRLFGAALAALVALTAGAIAATAHRADRRDPRSRASRARRRRTRRRQAPTGPRRRGLRGALGGDAADEVEAADVTAVHPDVRDDWERLLQARRLVQDLALDGWIEGASTLEVDGHVLRLHRLLVADARASELGGRSSSALRHQVSELADLLVALADEAVSLQVDDAGSRTAVPATLAHAHDHLRSLRAARREVEQVDQQRLQPGT